MTGVEYRENVIDLKVDRRIPLVLSVFGTECSKALTFRTQKGQELQAVPLVQLVEESIKIRESLEWRTRRYRVEGGT